MLVNFLAVMGLFAASAAAKVTGCTCNGYSYTYTNKFGETTTNDVLYRKDTAEKPTTNPAGWCFEDGVMTPPFQNHVLTAVSTGLSNQYVNASWALYQCQQLSKPVDSCAQEIIKIFTRALLGLSGNSMTYITKPCTYPAANFAPVDCSCGFECDPGYVLCGEGTATPSCINPATTACRSGLPANLNARRRLTECPSGLTQCANPFGPGFECLDTENDLEACGGCPGEPQSMDCSAIPGVSSVSCVDSQCHINTCDMRHILTEGECVLRL